MKKFYKLTLLFLFPLGLFSQVPEAINYQAVIRDNNHQVMMNQNVSLQISILAESAEGNLEFRERHFVQTNQFGLVNLQIGNGELIAGNMSDIKWGVGNYFLQIEIDISGGTSFELMGTSQMLSVPYALYAKNAENIDDADADPTNEIQAISISNDTIYMENGGFVKLPEDQSEDEDIDPENELQILSISNDTIYIENGGFVKLPEDKIEDDDSDPENEIQIISINEDTVFIEKGGYVILPKDSIDDADADPTNELQQFAVSHDNDTLFLSNGNYIIIPGISETNPHLTFECGELFYDTRDWQTYKTVKIGDQCWMAENLNIGIRNNHNVLPTNNQVIEKWCYDDLESNCDVYGGLYEINELTNYTNVERTQGVCPDGWHIPSYDEWNTLINYVGGESVAGNKLKETGDIHWKVGNEATDDYGFSILPAGTLHSPEWNEYEDLRYYGFYWTSTEIESFFNYYSFGFNTESSYSLIETYWHNLPVRCIKNEE